MKKFIIAILILGLTTHSQGQNKSNSSSNGDAIAGAAAIGVGVAAAAIMGAAQLEAMRTYAEYKALEWYLNEYDIKDGSRISVECLNLQGNKWKDISSTNSVVVSFKEYNSGLIVSGINDKPTIKQVIFIVSEGWWNSYGVDFNVVKPLVIDNSNVEEILLALINLMGNEKVRAYNRDSISFYNFRLYRDNESGQASMTKSTDAIVGLSNIAGDYKFNRGLKFMTDEGAFFSVIQNGASGHTFWDLQSLDAKLMLSNDGIGFYVKETKDLVLLKNRVLTKIFDPFGPLNEL